MKHVLEIEPMNIVKTSSDHSFSIREKQSIVVPFLDKWMLLEGEKEETANVIGLTSANSRKHMKELNIFTFTLSCHQIT